MALVVISNSGPASINISRTFAFNVEEYISTSKTFEWWVGEGPLYWWKIEWKKPICPPQQCVPSGTDCSIIPSNCGVCTPASDGPVPLCPEGVVADPKYGMDLNCFCDGCEIWHMLATSIQDLCAR